MPLHITLPDYRILSLGRVDQREHSLAFDWTNSGVYFRFYGNKVTFHFEAPALSQQLYLNVRLDGRAQRFLVNESSSDVTVFAENNTEHRVYFTRCNEILDAVPMILTGITIDGSNPSLLCAPALPERRMMFIGDSITCGFGNLADGPQPRFTTVEQDGSKTFAALTAAHFGAQAHFICISGRGVARNCDNVDFPLIPEFFEQTTISNPVPWDHKQYQPDVIVVNAGTNDTVGEESPISTEAFKRAVISFSNHLLTVYPNAKLLWCYGMMAIDMSEAVKEAIDSLQSDRADSLLFTSVFEGADEMGACSHPNVRAHYRCAGVLIDKLRHFIGWDI